MTRRTYDRPALDGTYQHFADRPFGGDGETVDVVDSDRRDPDTPGEEIAEDVEGGVVGGV